MSQVFDIFETKLGVRFEVTMGDITSLHVDCIVNAANAIMLGGGGVDGAIHRAAGPKLRDECLKCPVFPNTNKERCPTGVAVVLTKGPFNPRLAATDVIHTTGPIMRKGNDLNEGKSLLSNCIQNSLKIAAEQNYESIAFPAISCGIFNGIGPKWTKAAALCNVEASLNFLKEFHDKQQQHLPSADSRTTAATTAGKTDESKETADTISDEHKQDPQHPIEPASINDGEDKAGGDEPSTPLSHHNPLKLKRIVWIFIEGELYDFWISALEKVLGKTSFQEVKQPQQQQKVASGARK